MENKSFLGTQCYVNTSSAFIVLLWSQRLFECKCNGSWTLYHSRSPTHVSCKNLFFFLLGTELSFLIGQEHWDFYTLVNLVARDQKTWRFFLCKQWPISHPWPVFWCGVQHKAFQWSDMAGCNELTPKGRRSCFLLQNGKYLKEEVQRVEDGKG